MIKSKNPIFVSIAFSASRATGLPLLSGVGVFMKKEIWKDIVGYEGVYKISNLGNVLSLERIVYSGRNLAARIFKERILAAKPNNCGYRAVTLSKNGIPKTVIVHRLVAEHFIPNPQCKFDITSEGLDVRIGSGEAKIGGYRVVVSGTPRVFIVNKDTYM